MAYFDEKAKEDPDFFYRIRLDDEDRVRNMYWVDGGGNSVDAGTKPDSSLLLLATAGGVVDLTKPIAYRVDKVSGKRVGIVGLGNIGSRVARRLAAFGCAVSYHSRSPKPSAPYPFVPALRELAAGSDVLVLSCALTDETKHMVNRDVMEALGKGGVLVNVGRGGLGGEPELLLAMDNVVLSDHRAVLTTESIGGVLEVVIANLDAFFSGRPLVSPVQL
ncbi:Glyoxylate reductase [Triticum urartu]|uniref:Glyoxylate reductase n=1 Tax=Triticum urartu TaxID=4572 RepID=M7ZVZ1_TRIUA|nr:Glyoxylate reductase [Triticum urartu]